MLRPLGSRQERTAVDLRIGVTDIARELTVELADENSGIESRIDVVEPTR
ncbi:MAG TPA: hypothetical protein PLV68_08680 [Ilumatobacteraceae bacterium]|nr:hypothetical protein [Ilumatobacteraceae bacterium]